MAFFRNVSDWSHYFPDFIARCANIIQNHDLRKRDILFRFEQNLIIIWVFSLNDAFLQSVLEGKNQKRTLTEKWRILFCLIQIWGNRINLKCYWFKSHSTFSLLMYFTNSFCLLAARRKFAKSTACIYISATFLRWRVCRFLNFYGMLKPFH